jgi:hypothetical protein
MISSALDVGRRNVSPGVEGEFLDLEWRDKKIFFI